MKALLKLGVAVAIFSFLSLSPLSAASLQGRFEIAPPMIAPQAHSLDTVVIHEVFFFGCPHCFALHKELPEFLKAYGKKIKMISVPIGWAGPDAGRLLMIARNKSPEKEEAVKEMIFDFIHNKGLGKSMFSRDKLQFVAKLNGLSKEFNTQMDDPKIVKMMDQAMAYAKEKGVESTPTLILNDAVKVVGADLANLKIVINSLLKEPVP